MKDNFQRIKLKYFILTGLLVMALIVTVFFLVFLVNIFILPQVENAAESGDAIKAMVIFAGVFGAICGFIMKSLFVINAEVIFYRGTFFKENSFHDRNNDRGD